MSDKHKPIVGFVLATAVVLSLWVYATPRGSGESAKLTGWSHNVAEATALAQEDSRPILMMFTADWCGPCQAMKKGVLSDADVDSTLSEKFSLVMIDIDDQENRQITSKYNIEAVPTFIIADADGKEQKRMVGGDDKGAFLAWAK